MSSSSQYTDWFCHKSCIASVETRQLQICDINSKSFNSKGAAESCGISQIQIRNCISVDTCSQSTLNLNDTDRPEVTVLELDDREMNLKINCQNELKNRTDQKLKGLIGKELPIEWHFQGKIINNLKIEKQGIFEQVIWIL